MEPTPQFNHEEGPKELNEHGIADVSSTPTGLLLPVRRLPFAEILPIPCVPQTGPRNIKTNRLGRTRVLTNEDKFEIIQEDEARRREKERKKWKRPIDEPPNQRICPRPKKKLIVHVVRRPN